jgi:glycerol kinase
MANSDYFVQRLTDLTDVPVRRSEFHEMTALGAALFAGLASGVYSSLEEAAAVRPTSKQIRPTIDPSERQSALARWADAVPRVRSRQNA